MQKIAIIGSGWYGLYTALLLQNNYDITIFEKNEDIFNNSSYYNQNRLHLGYHYPKSHKTRQLCLDGFEKFLNLFSSVVEDCPNNFYVISNNSCIDYETFIQIFNTSQYNHTIIKNNFLNNIEQNIINVNEKIINSDKAKYFFKKNLNKVKFVFNTRVSTINNYNNTVLINDTHIYDYCINCTYNQLNNDNENYIFEKTISLIYNRIHKLHDFNAITIMDGGFSSIFPKNLEKNEYTLTNVFYTPFKKSQIFNEVENYNLTNDEFNVIKNNMENDIKLYLPDFEKEFEFTNYFTAFKCKIKNSNDSRHCIIAKNENIISVHCGKIIGIFEFEEYLKNIFLF